MSRVNWNDEENFQGQFALWQANTERSIKGKKGQQALKELREALIALRDYHGPRLIEGALCTVGGVGRDEIAKEWYSEELQETIDRQGEGVCAVGAYAWWKAVQANNSVGEAFKSLPTLPSFDTEMEDTVYEGEKRGMPKLVAYEVVWRNDELYAGFNITPEERYNKFISWLDGVIIN